MAGNPLVLWGITLAYGATLLSGSHRISFWAAVLLFLASRLYVLLWADIQGSTLAEVNVTYAITFEQAAREGVPFYAEIESLRHRIEDERRLNGPIPQPIEFRVE